jgi:hypothetical protein
VKSKRTTSIRVETYEVTTVRRRPSSMRAWCVACATEVEMMTPERAAEWAAISSKAISGWLEAGKLHAAEIAPRLLYICLNSLRQQMRELQVVKTVQIQTSLAAKGKQRAGAASMK